MEIEEYSSQTPENFNPSESIVSYFHNGKFRYETLENFQNFPPELLAEIFKGKGVLIEAHGFGNSKGTRMCATTLNLSKDHITIFPKTWWLKGNNIDKGNEIFTQLAGDGGIFLKAGVTKETEITCSGDSIGNYLAVTFIQRSIEEEYKNLKLIMDRPAYSFLGGVNQSADLGISQHIISNVRTLVFQNSKFDHSGFGFNNYHTKKVLSNLIEYLYKLNNNTIPQTQLNSLKSAVGATFVVKDEDLGIDENNPELFVRVVGNFDMPSFYFGNLIRDSRLNFKNDGYKY